MVPCVYCLVQACPRGTALSFSSLSRSGLGHVRIVGVCRGKARCLLAVVQACWCLPCRLTLLAWHGQTSRRRADAG